MELPVFGDDMELFGDDMELFGGDMELPILQDVTELSIDENDHVGPSSGPAAGPPAADRPRKKGFYPKRSHKKSRMGCQNCKARRVKCDEQRPSCQTCIVRKQACVYVAPSRRKAPQKSQPASTRSRTSRTGSSCSSDAASDRSYSSPVVVVHEPVASLPGCDPVDMKLIWHFMVNASSSFSSEGGSSQDVMRVKVMKHAFDVRFLFRSVLALSCLHARTVCGEEMGDAARHHFYQNESLHEYRLAIEAAEPRTFGALLSNSLLVTATSSENFRDPTAPNLYILQWLLVWRGIGAIFGRINRTSLASTGLTQLFHRPSMNLEEGARHIPQHLTRMILSIEPQDADFSHKATYLHGLKYLGSLYQHMRQGGLNPVMKLRIITWFTFLPPALVELFRKKRERALVILAHYAVFLKFTVGVWWLVGVGDRTLRDICRHLGPAWRQELDVPLRAINVDDATDLARLLLDDPVWEIYTMSAGSWEQDQERETTAQLGLVDDEGRPIRVLQDAGTIVLAEPSEPGERPVWNMDG
ncbi:hypothetical protein E4U41_003374 [Claviceps citrina]|nr:hypothetical protein E4U41_003374 [Claviceps citrina]